jgi:hypothetical protein
LTSIHNEKNNLEVLSIKSERDGPTEDCFRIVMW